ncbi:MAG: serine/threonine-protein kinase [Myxococcota bacterium]|nr:serine/threonine-protein kinase [Myxococcota bacterium]
METEHTIINAKRCPTCGYRGEADICPFDGTGMVENINLSQRLLDSKASKNLEVGPAELNERVPSEASEVGVARLTRPPTLDRAKNLVGTTLGGRYQLNEVIGRGGMGTVYAAEQPSVGRTVAVKVLNQEFTENPMVVRRFHQEAQAASKLTHPNTISVYDFGETDGSLYIVMEHLVGETLKSLLKRTGRLELNRTCLIMSQVLKSIAQAHEAGVVHRDLKPDNIFITRIDDGSEFVKVLDFGVAKLRKADDSDTTLTQMGAVFGTPKYMAPEQTQNISVDGRADLYSVGILLYELLLGSVPFDGENPLAILMDHANRSPATFEDVDPEHGYHPAVQSVVMKALEKDRDSRYASAREFLNDLDMLERSSRADAGIADQDALSRLVRIKDRWSNSELNLGEELRNPVRPAPGYKVPTSILTSSFAGILLVALGLYFGQSDRKEATNTPSIKKTDSLGSGTLNADTVDPKTQVSNGQTASVLKAVSATGKQRAPFVFETVPAGAKLVDVKTGRRLGQTPKTIEFSKKAVIEARLDGYKIERFYVDPGNETRPIKRTLIATRPASVRPTSTLPSSAQKKSRLVRAREAENNSKTESVSKPPMKPAIVEKKPATSRSHKTSRERRDDDVDFEME